jgi:hypothetical protein
MDADARAVQNPRIFRVSFRLSLKRSKSGFEGWLHDRLI